MKYHWVAFNWMQPPQIGQHSFEMSTSRGRQFKNTAQLCTNVVLTLERLNIIHSETHFKGEISDYEASFTHFEKYFQVR